MYTIQDGLVVGEHFQISPTELRIHGYIYNKHFQTVLHSQRMLARINHAVQCSLACDQPIDHILMPTLSFARLFVCDHFSIEDMSRFAVEFMDRLRIQSGLQNFRVVCIPLQFDLVKLPVYVINEGLYNAVRQLKLFDDEFGLVAHPCVF